MSAREITVGLSPGALPGVGSRDCSTPEPSLAVEQSRTISDADYWYGSGGPEHWRGRYDSYGVLIEALNDPRGEIR